VGGGELVTHEGDQEKEAGEEGRAGDRNVWSMAVKVGWRKGELCGGGRE